MSSEILLPVGPRRQMHDAEAGSTGIWSVLIAADQQRIVTFGGAVTSAPISAAELLRKAVARPIGMDRPLRDAITPDDHVCVVVDEQLPQLSTLLRELIAHLRPSGIDPQRITLILPPSGDRRHIDGMIPEVGVEVHDPADEKKHAYLATTKAGRRIYMNRTLIEADFVIVLAGRRYDWTLGYTGAETALFPCFSNDEVRKIWSDHYTTKVPSLRPHELRLQAAEVAWLVGLPAYVQPIEGPGDTIAEVVVELGNTSPVGAAATDARWRGTVGERADLVIATISGASERIRFEDLAFALGTAARVVKKGGRIVLLTETSPDWPESVEALGEFDDPESAVRAIRKRKMDEAAPAIYWALAAKQANLYVAGGYSEDELERMFATQVTKPAEVQRLIDASASVIVIPDAHKTVVEVA